MFLRKLGGAETTSKTEESSLDLNTMSYDELYEYLLNVDDMDALCEEYPNLNDLISKLSEDQQNQLAKKFGNSEEDVELIDNNDNTISPSSDVVNITKGGEYTVKGGTYTISNYAIVINTDEKVTLNINGDITCNYGFVQIKSSGEVFINGNNHKVYSGNRKYVLFVYSDANPTITMNNGEFGSNTQSTYIIKGGSSATNLMTLNNSTFIKRYNDETIVYANNLKINNCTFNNGNDAIFVGKSLSLDGTTTFTGSASSDVKLNDGATMNFDDNYSADTSIKLSLSNYSSITSENPKRVISTSGVSKNMVEKITSTNASYPVNYGVDEKGNGYLYLWNHTHDYTDIKIKDNNSLIAKCSNSECDRSIVLATLNANDSSFTSKSYDGASVSYKDLVKKGDIKYKKKSDTEYSTTAPTQVGEYIVSVDVTYNEKTYTLTKEFKITNRITPSSNTVTITKGGTYDIEGGTFTIPNEGYAISINTTENVNLNILGNITCSEGEGRAYGFIDIQNAGEVEINANSYKIDGDFSIMGYGVCVSSNTKVTLNGGVYSYFHVAVYTEKDDKQLILNGCTLNCPDNNCVVAKNVVVENCTFNGGNDFCLYIRNNGNVTFKGAQNNIDTITRYYGDVYLRNGATLTLEDGTVINDSDYKLKVYLNSSLDCEGQQLVTTNTSKGMMDKITSTQGYTAIYKDNAIYFLKHHVWTYRADGNVLSATCKNEGCEYHNSALTTTLNADGGMYNGEKYVANVMNNNDNVTYSKEDIKYYDKDGKVLEKAPKVAGTYKAEVDLTYGETTTTLTKEFTISKANQTAPTVDDISVTDESIKGQANGAIKNKTSKAMEYSIDKKNYTSIDGSVSNLAAGTYYVRYKELDNYNASKNLEVEVKSGKSLSVIVPAKQIGYTLSVDHSSVDYNGSSKITFKLADGYSKTDVFAVKVNGKEIALDKNGEYTIKDIQSDQSITVEGVKDITVPTTNGKEDANTHTNNGSGQKKSTNTGVQLNIGLYTSLIIISLIEIVVLVKKKRFE